MRSITWYQKLTKVITPGYDFLQRLLKSSLIINFAAKMAE